MNNSFVIVCAMLLFSCAESKIKTDHSSNLTSINEKFDELIILKDSLQAETDLISQKLDSKLLNIDKKTKLVQLAKKVNKEIVNQESTKEVLNTRSTNTKDSIPNNVLILTPNHITWNILTKKYVSYTGKVNYLGFKSELKLLESYIAHLAKVSPKREWSRYEQLAYWFNLYNASTIQLILQSYPVGSIKDINNGKPWDKEFIVSGNNTYSLNQIENKIVRPNFNEPRVHVAFNCAAVSCPKLLNEAFTPAKLNYQLNKLTRYWINDRDKNQLSDNNLKISKIFKWYSKDFPRGVISFINEYSTIKISETTSINYLDYNWNLND